MSDLSKNLLFYRKKFNYSQQKVANKLGKSQQAYQKYEKGTAEPDSDSLHILANLYEVSIDTLIGNISTKQNRIPVLGSIPAGIPIEMIEDVIDYEDISPEMFNNGKEYFALKIKGNSMAPKYLDGDVIIVRKQDNCESGQDCVVAVNGNDATFKKVIKKEDCIILQPINTAEYEPALYNNQQIETLPVRILGIAVEIRRTI